MDDHEAEVSKYKQELFKDLRGTIVEIGAGTGANLKYYPKEAKLIGIEPNIFMQKHFADEAKKCGFTNFKLIESGAEKMPLPDCSVDMVVSTLVMCSVDHPKQVIDEIKRILKPGGKYLFLEHVAAKPFTFLYVCQKVCKPFWKLYANGCNTDRATGNTIRNAGFSSIDLKEVRINAYRLIAPHIVGAAIK